MITAQSLIIGGAKNTSGGSGGGIVGAGLLSELAVYIGNTTIEGSPSIIAPAIVSMAAPIVTPEGTGGLTTWSYSIYAVQGNVLIAHSAIGQTMVGNASLNGTNYNKITWAAVPGADHYIIQNENPNYAVLTTVAAPTLTVNDTTGTTPNFLYYDLSESGFVGIINGLHVGVLASAFAAGTNICYNAAAMSGSPLISYSTTTTAAIAGILQTSGANADPLGFTLRAGLFHIDVTDAVQTPHIYGIEAIASSTTNSTQPGPVAGASLSGVNNGTGTVTALYGLDSGVYNNATGIVTIAAAIHISTPLNIGGGTITTAYGILIDDQVNASTNYAIKTGSGLLSFGGAATFNNTVALTTAPPTVSGGQVGLGSTTGFGNGSAGTAMTTTTKNTGSGPTTPQTVVGYLEINVGGTAAWIPYVQ